MRKLLVFLLGIALIVGILVYVVADINDGDGLEAESQPSIVRIEPSYFVGNLSRS